MAFARLVTHYVGHDNFLEDGVLLRDADLLADIPGVLVQGRTDLQAPIGSAWALARAWPTAELIVLGDVGSCGRGSGTHTRDRPRDGSIRQPLDT